MTHAASMGDTSSSFPPATWVGTLEHSLPAGLYYGKWGAPHANGQCWSGGHFHSIQTPIQHGELLGGGVGLLWDQLTNKTSIPEEGNSGSWGLNGKNFCLCTDVCILIPADFHTSPSTTREQDSESRASSISILAAPQRAAVGRQAQEIADGGRRQENPSLQAEW